MIARVLLITKNKVRQFQKIQKRISVVKGEN